MQEGLLLSAQRKLQSSDLYYDQIKSLSCQKQSVISSLTLLACPRLLITNYYPHNKDDRSIALNGSFNVLNERMYTENKTRMNITSVVIVLQSLSASTNYSEGSESCILAAQLYDLHIRRFQRTINTFFIITHS